MVLRLRRTRGPATLVAMSGDQAGEPSRAARMERFFSLSAELLAIAEDGNFATINPAWEHALGWTSGDLIGTPLTEQCHPDDVSEMHAFLAGGFRVEGHETLRCRYQHRDGSWRSLRWSCSDEAETLFLVVRDVTEFVAALRQAERTEALSSAVLSTAVDPIIVINSRGIIQRANQATSDLFGYSWADLEGQNVSMLMPQPYRGEHDGYLQHYHQTGEAKVIGIGREVEAQRADGSTFPMALSVSEVISGDQERWFTGIIHDLTAIRSVQDDLEQANARLEARVRSRTEELERLNTEFARSNRDLQQFAYIASHDLQSPLRNVRQGLELLDEHLETTTSAGFDAEAVELRGLVMDSVSRMEQLIKGLLSYSRVQRNTERNDVRVDLHAVAEDVLIQLASDLETAGASVTLGELPSVRGEVTQLRQLLQNLVQNAIKYRAHDRPSIIHIQSEKSEEPGHLVISVRDNGIGIDQQHHERIFELFRRGHAGYDGVGLGLAICQSIVDRHGGRIWVESEVGAGATFSFSLAADPTPKPE